MLEWNVFVSDFNTNKVTIDNLFSLSCTFNENCIRNAKKNKNDEAAFKEQLRKDMAYTYWSRCEWELIISCLFQRNGCERKISIYDQVMMNWNQFSDYVWEHRGEIK